MSYILDALRKAEDERSIGDKPQLSFTPLSETQSKSGWWIWGIVAALGIAVGVLGAMQLSQWRSEPMGSDVAATAPVKPAAKPAGPKPVAPKVVVTTASPQPAPSPAAVKKRPVQVNTPQGPVTVDMPVQPEVRPAPPAPQPAAPVPEREAVVEEQPVEEPPAEFDLPPASEVAAEYANGGATEDEAAEPEPEESVAEPEPERLVSYNGLPASTRNSIGELAMNAHVYSSTPGRGFVIINGVRYRAGDSLNEGPALDEIRTEGAVLDYRGQRFLLPVPR